jgi:RNA polymerase sigma-70 factor (ECF subfamily)
MAGKRCEHEIALDELGECVSDREGEMCDAMALRMALDSFLRSLDRRSRIIFLQRYFYTCPVAEIAERHGLKESAVTMLLFRTRQKLREHLHKEGIEL